MVYEGQETQLAQDAVQVLCRFENKQHISLLNNSPLQARNISVVLSTCKAKVELACNYSLGNMSKINVSKMKHYGNNFSFHF